MNVACGILINLPGVPSVCESGHRAPTCPLSGLCRRCRQPGHVARECTQSWDPSFSAPAPGTNMPSGPSTSFDHVMADAFPIAPDRLFLFSTSFPGHFSASSQRRKALGTRLVCSAPVSVAAPVPASVDSTPTTVPAAAPSRFLLLLKYLLSLLAILLLLVLIPPLFCSFLAILKLLRES